MINQTSPWSERVKQELTQAVQAGDVKARTAHLELAILHLEADANGKDDPGWPRKSLTTALFARMAFAAD